MSDPFGQTSIDDIDDIQDLDEEFDESESYEEGLTNLLLNVNINLDKY